MTSSPMPTSSRRRCPICGKTPSDALKPFCSARCRDRDLLQWLGDGYALPGPPAELDEDGTQGLRPASDDPHDM